MTDAERAIIERVNGDKLTQAIRAFAADMSADNLATYSAELVNRCADMVSGMIVHLDRKIDELARQRDD
jgi:hypothetical protein